MKDDGSLVISYFNQGSLSIQPLFSKGNDQENGQKTTSIRLEDVHTDSIADLGDFPWVQITYDYIKIPTEDANDVIHVAYYGEKSGDWWLDKDFSKQRGLRRGPWTDIIFG